MTRKVVPPPRGLCRSMRPPKRLHSVLQAEKTGAAGKFGASHTVIGDLQAQSAIGLIRFDASP